MQEVREGLKIATRQPIKMEGAKLMLIFFGRCQQGYPICFNPLLVSWDSILRPQSDLFWFWLQLHGDHHRFPPTHHKFSFWTLILEPKFWPACPVLLSVSRFPRGLSSPPSGAQQSLLNLLARLWCNLLHDAGAHPVDSFTRLYHGRCHRPSLYSLARRTL